MRLISPISLLEARRIYKAHRRVPDFIARGYAYIPGARCRFFDIIVGVWPEIGEVSERGKSRYRRVRC